MTPRRRAFVREYLLDPNATQAAINAGFSKKTAYSQGQRLLKNVEVQQAIKAAQAKAAERHEITMETISDMLKQDREDAKKDGQHGAVVSATMGLAKLHGLITDKVENTNRNLGSGERKRRISELLDRQGRAGIAGAARTRSGGNGARKPH